MVKNGKVILGQGTSLRKGTELGKALGPEQRVWWKRKRRQDTSEQRTVGRGSRGSEAGLESTLALGYWASEPHLSHS